ncbi:MAG: DUF4013 domain-containing protein [Verrucomicrobiota bacterium]
MDGDPKSSGKDQLSDAGSIPSVDVSRSIEMGFGPAVRCLFRDKDWGKRFWIVPLMAILPLINLILLRGWRFELTRRLMRREAPSLPEPSQLPVFFVSGLALWMMTAVYFLPHGIFGFVHFLHLSHLAEADSPRFWAEFLIVSAMAWLLWLFTWPFYRVAMLRFAASGSLLSFFLLPQNLFVIIRNVFGLLGLWLCFFVTVVVYGILVGVLAATGIGVLVGLVFGVPMLYATMAHFMAQLGSRLSEKHGWLINSSTGKWSDSGPLQAKPLGLFSVSIGFLGTAAFLGVFTVLVVLFSLSSLGGHASEIPELVPWAEAMRSFDFEELWRLINEEALPQIRAFFEELKSLFEKEADPE